MKSMRRQKGRFASSDHLERRAMPLGALAYADWNADAGDRSKARFHAMPAPGVRRAKAALPDFRRAISA